MEAETSMGIMFGLVVVAFVVSELWARHCDLRDWQRRRDERRRIERVVREHADRAGEAMFKAGS